VIPGVTDRRRLPRLGKIRLGEKRENANGRAYPAKLDYFSFRDVPEVEKIYGAQCRSIFPVVFPSDDEETWFPTSRSAYRQTGLFCRCSDGETATRVRVPVEQRGDRIAGDEQGEAYIAEHKLDVKPGAMYELPCPGDDCPYTEGKFCRRLGRLFFMLPKVPKFGVYEITTTSFNSIVNVLNYARSVQGLTGGVLAGIPFALLLKPMKVQPGGKATTVYVLELECLLSLSQLAGMSRRIRLGGGPLAGYLPAGDVEAADETPDDLYGHAGADLDASLSGDPIPGGVDDLNSRLGQAPTEDLDFVEPPDLTTPPRPQPGRITPAQFRAAVEAQAPLKPAPDNGGSSPATTTARPKRANPFA